MRPGTGQERVHIVSRGVCPGSLASHTFPRMESGGGGNVPLPLHVPGKEQWTLPIWWEARKGVGGGNVRVRMEGILPGEEAGLQATRFRAEGQTEPG